jgi:hypothetical protein
LRVITGKGERPLQSALALRGPLPRSIDRSMPRLVAARSAAERGSIVLYPHFDTGVTPGWLDKHLPWRRATRRHPWLDNVLLIAPSASLIERLPNRKLPDRHDFYRYGADHAGRERAWNGAINECGRFAEAVLRWMARPDPTLIRPI